MFIASYRVRVGRDHLDPETAREFPRRDTAGRGGQVRPLLLDAWAALLLDEDHQDIRDYAAKRGIAEETAAIAQGLREKAEGVLAGPETAPGTP